jgi:ankyrin repeat protein
MLILNLTPDEFKQRKQEIIGEFSKQMGIFMLIKKDANAQDMIYPYAYKPAVTWTKVYFIVIFTCVDELANAQAANRSTCFNDFINNIKHSPNLPDYVTNITYEANEIRGNDVRPLQPAVTNNTTIIVVCVIIGVLLTVIVLLGMIVRQQQAKQRIRAPIWFPPMTDKVDLNSCNINNHTSTTNAKNWSFQKGLKSMFRTDSPPGCIDYAEKPNLLQKVENNSSCDSSTPFYHQQQQNSSDYFSSASTTTSPAESCDLGTTQSEFLYPSPPESVPDYHSGSYYYANIKGPSGVTSLMCVLMNRKQSLTCTLDLIDTLISKGANINQANANDGETALHYAARLGLHEVCDKLLNYGADVNLYDKQGRTVLHTAVGANNGAIVKLFYQKLGEKLDIDVKTIDYLGETALIYAARNAYNDVLKMLIQLNSTVNATDNNGQSALHWCAKVNNCKGAILLLESGANINLQDENEKTPISVAIDELNTNEIVQLLVKYQAFVSSEDEKLLELKKKRICNQTQQIDVKTENELKPAHEQPAGANRKRKLNPVDQQCPKSTRSKPDANAINRHSSYDQNTFYNAQVNASQPFHAVQHDQYPSYSMANIYAQQPNVYNFYANQFQNANKPFENTSFCAYF